METHPLFDGEKLGCAQRRGNGKSELSADIPALVHNPLRGVWQDLGEKHMVESKDCNV